MTDTNHESQLPTVRAISLGAGVQSTAVLMLALNGDIEADCAIFADTGWEPRAVYDHLRDLRRRCMAAGFPLHIVSQGNIREDTLSEGRFASMPFFITGDDGKAGMVRRQCTKEYKIAPLRRKLRELMSEAGVKRASFLMGISVDEIQRMSDSRVKYLRHEYPLIDLGWSRQSCIAYLERLGMTAPRSACIGCPFHSDREWRSLEPDEFADAVFVDRAVREKQHKSIKGTPFLHRARVPLDEVDLDPNRNQLDLWDDECVGVCGV